jgi:hypothetical protein
VALQIQRTVRGVLESNSTGGNGTGSTNGTASTNSTGIKEKGKGKEEGERREREDIITIRCWQWCIQWRR